MFLLYLLTVQRVDIFNIIFPKTVTETNKTENSNHKAVTDSWLHLIFLKSSLQPSFNKKKKDRMHTPLIRHKAKRIDSITTSAR